jgi:hypothetical protein
MEEVLPLLRILCSSGLIVVVVIVAMGFASIICLLLLLSNQSSIRGSLCFFELNTNDFFERHSSGVVPRDFVEVAPLPSVLICLPITLLFLWLGLVVLRLIVL